MSSPNDNMPKPGWRANGATVSPWRPTVFRHMLFLLLGGIFLCLTGLGVFLVVRQTPPQPHFLPLCVTAYESPALTAAPTVRHDLERLCALFDRVAARNWAAPTRADLFRQLDDLAALSANDDAVVYLSGHAFVSGAEIRFLPADVALEDSRTAVPFSEVLDRLRNCPARRQLLILDIMHAGAAGRCGAPAGEVARALAAHLDAVPDDRRLVLTACAPGQAPQTFSLTGQSVFAMYLEEGLRGAADGFGPEGRRDGQVAARELGAFVQTRVDRWTRLNRGVRQTPQLHGAGPDFPLAATVDGPLAEASAPTRGETPPWLTTAYEQCERLLDDGTFRRNPRAFQKMLAVLADARRALGASGASESLPISLHKKFDQLREQFPKATNPVNLTLALESEPANQEPNLAKFIEALDQAHRQFRQAAARESEAVESRFLAQWPVKTRHVTARDRDAAVVGWLARRTPVDAASVRFADAVLRAGSDAEPRYVETLSVRMLADLANRMPGSTWSNTSAQRVLTLALGAEQSIRRPDTFAWLQTELDQATQLKHEGEIALWSVGYVASDRAPKLLADAEQRFLELNGRAERLAATFDLVDLATALLPGYAPMLDVLPQRQPTWIDAVRLTSALLEARAAAPAEADARAKSLLLIDEQAIRLRKLLETLRGPFTTERVLQLVQQSEPADAGPPQLLELEAMLDTGVGWLRSGDKPRVEKAVQTLALRLHESTRRLDRSDDADKTSPLPDDADHLRRQGVAQAQRTLALLDLGGVVKERLQPLRSAGARLVQDPKNPAAWNAWGQALRDLYAVGLPEQLAKQSTLHGKERLSRVYPAREPLPAFDTGESPALRIRHQELQTAWTWLAERCRYQARDYAGLGLDTPGIHAARRFYADAANTQAALRPEACVTMKIAAPLERLHAGLIATSSSMNVDRMVPPGVQGPTQVQVVMPDAAWLEVTPNAAELPGVKNDGAARTVSTQMPLRIELRAGAERSQTPAPSGFLILARCDLRAYHRLVPAPVNVAPQAVDIAVSSNPKVPEPNLDELRLRPGNVRQSFFVYLKNLGPQPRSVLVELLTGGSLVAGGTTRMTLPPGQFERVRFHEAPPPLGPAALPDANGPLEVRVFDADKKLAPLAVRRIPVMVFEPRDYVRIAGAQVEPGPLVAATKVSVTLQAMTKIAGPGIPAQLVLPAQRGPDLPNVSMQREVPTQGRSDSVSLAAETSRSATNDDESPIYVTVDGVPRAFVFRTAQGSRAAAPRPDENLAIRIRAASSMQPAERTPVTVEVDNAPRDARLEVAVALPNGAIEVVHRYASAQQHRLGFSPHGPDGALVFEAAIRDWKLTLDSAAWHGRRVLKARLIDVQGRELQHSLQELIVDTTPPDDVEFVAPPAQAQQGTTLKLIAQGIDRESDIDRVLFFLGKPDGHQPTPGTSATPGFPVDSDHGWWGGSIPLPANHKGPLPVSVQFVNRAGLTRCASISVELLDVDPASIRPGSIVGTILEGPRPQPGLTVILRDDQGRDKAKTRTQPDGGFRFDAVSPGRYQIFCVKPESGRRVLQSITISPGATQKLSLALSL